jgi:hypothetical protein
MKMQVLFIYIGYCAWMLTCKCVVYDPRGYSGCGHGLDRVVSYVKHLDACSHARHTTHLKKKKHWLWPASSSHDKCGVNNFVFYILTFCYFNTKVVVLMLVRFCIINFLKMDPRSRNTQELSCVMCDFNRLMCICWWFIVRIKHEMYTVKK